MSVPEPVFRARGEGGHAAGVLCVGEVLIDCIGGLEHPGGAPANVACHAARLGAGSGLISRVGRDDHGLRLQAWLREAGVGGAALQIDPSAPTGVVRVELAGDGPRYRISAPVAWDFLEATPEAVALAERARVLVCGTLAQRHPAGRAAVRGLVAAGRAAGARVLADLNLRAPFFDEEVVLWTVRHADVLKLNADELGIVAGLLGAGGERAGLFGGLVREFGVPAAVLTCGDEGAWCHEGGATWHVPAVGVKVADTVGAGDAFTAVLASALAGGRTLREAAPWCAEVAAYVASQPGAVPPLPDGLVARWRRAMAGD